jgi:hypothetical protein
VAGRLAIRHNNTVSRAPVVRLTALKANFTMLDGINSRARLPRLLSFLCDSLVNNWSAAAHL